MWIRSLYYLKKSFELVKAEPEKLSEFQENRVQNIIDTCLELPFYADKIDNIDPSIKEIPLTGSKEFRTVKGDMRYVLNSQGESFRQTSGSTGEPAKIGFSSQAGDWMSAVHARTLYLIDYRFGSQITQLWQDEEQNQSRIGEWFIPRKHVRSSKSLGEQLEALEKQDLEVMHYFPQVLLSLAKYVEGSEHHINPDLIITYGEVMTPETRKFIEKVFEAPVKDLYSTTEFGNVAWECPEGGYHINEDLVYPEILSSQQRPVKEGETGELVLTGLVNEITPLVRYAIGDLVKTSEDTCSCETSFRRIESIRGRKEDVFLNSYREPIYPDQVIDTLAPFEDIIYFQIVAEEENYTLKYVPAEDFREKAIEEAVEILRSELKLEKIEKQEMDKLDRGKGGKVPLVDNRQQLDPNEMF